MKRQITTAQLDALRTLAAASPETYPLMRELCDRIEQLQPVEEVAMRYVMAMEIRSQTLCERELRRTLGVVQRPAVGGSRAA